VNDLEIKGAVAASMTAASFSKVGSAGISPAPSWPSEMRTGRSTDDRILQGGQRHRGVFSATGNVTKFSAQQWTGGSITARDFNDVTFTGRKGVQGDFAKRHAESDRDTPAEGIHNLVVKGNLDAVAIDATNGIVTGISRTAGSAAVSTQSRSSALK